MIIKSLLFFSEKTRLPMFEARKFIVFIYRRLKKNYYYTYEFIWIYTLIPFKKIIKLNVFS